MSQTIQKSNLFLVYFRSLIENGCVVDVELKNSVIITGKLEFVDNNMCMLLRPDESDLKKLPPQFASMKSGIYIRGSAVRAVYMPTIQTELDMMKSICQGSK